MWDTTGRPRCNFSSRYLPWFDKGGLLEKWWGTGRWGRNKKKIKQAKMYPNKFIQSEPQRKKNNGKDGPTISLKPKWFPVCQRLFLRGFRFLSCLHHSATREKSFFLAAPPLVSSAFGRHRRFPLHARKTSGYPGYQNDNIFWWEGENLCLNKRRQDKIINW